MRSTRSCWRTSCAPTRLPIGRCRQAVQAMQAMRVLTRAQQDAAWENNEVTHRVRTLLKAFFPAALAAFERGGRHRLDSAACRTILTAAPTPAGAGQLTARQLAALLRRAGRQSGIAEEAARLRDLLGQDTMRQLPPVERAMGCSCVACRTQPEQVDALTSRTAAGARPRTGHGVCRRSRDRGRRQVAGDFLGVA